jgi:hypothetical protein
MIVKSTKATLSISGRETTKMTSRRHLTAKPPFPSAPDAFTVTWNLFERDRFERNRPHNSSGETEDPQYVEDVPVIRYVSNGRSVLMND